MTKELHPEAESLDRSFRPIYRGSLRLQAKTGDPLPSREMSGTWMDQTFVLDGNGAVFETTFREREPSQPNTDQERNDLVHTLTNVGLAPLIHPVYASRLKLLTL